MDFSAATLASILDLATERHAELHTAPTIARAADIHNALTSLPKSLPLSGLGTEEALKFVREKIAPGFAAGQAGPRYFSMNWTYGPH